MSILLSPDTNRKRLVVLGLDGLPLDLAKALGDSLPNIGRIAREATTVRAELPELSPVNWTSFYTGEGPETHGIFGFSRMYPGYQLNVANSSDVACPTIFDRLGEAGMVSRIINLPNMYPARPLRGMAVSGYVAPDLERAAHPPFFAQKLAEAGYKLEADTERGRSDFAFLLKELRETLASRRTALDMIWPDLGWDLFIHVFTETDRLFHFCMDAVMDKSHTHHLECMRFLADLDAAIGDFLARYDMISGPKRLIVMADHGFTQLKTEVCINTWLKQNGSLTIDGTPANGWDATVIGHKSKAFALDPGRIYIHTRDRFERGCVEPNEKDVLMDAIRDGLMQVAHEGTPVMKAVHTAADLYPGATSAHVPDLVCETWPGYDLKAKFDRDEVFGFHGRTGTHTVDGAIYFDSDGFQPGSMRDIGTTILNYFNIK